MGFWKRFVAPASSADQAFKHITPQEAQALLQANASDPNFVLLDIRTPAEFAQGHLEKAINIDFYANNFAQQLGQLDKGKKYLMYCRSGNRSGKALSLMQQLQFSQVYNMTGGIAQWQAKGFPVVK